jgi:hypothetical protein
MHVPVYCEDQQENNPVSAELYTKFTGEYFYLKLK